MLKLLITSIAIVWAGNAEASVVSRDPAAVPAGLYVLDKEHVSVVAKVSHMGFSRYAMRFDRITGGFSWDPKDPDAAQVKVEIDADSLDTGSATVSENFAHVFLDSEAHPKITFVSSHLERMSDGTGVLTGDLTLRGITRPVTLNVVFNGVGPGLLAGHRLGFSATGRIARGAFGSTTYAPTLVGDDVDLEIEAEFYRK